MIRLEGWFEWLFLSFWAFVCHMSLSAISEACTSSFVFLFLCFGICISDLCKFWSVYIHVDNLVVVVTGLGLGSILGLVLQLEVSWK